MPIQSVYGDTVLLRDFSATSTAEKLNRVHFVSGSSSTTYDEHWLQNLIMQQPGLLPVSQIEPTFSEMVPVCTELPTRAGFVDNLFITPKGDIAIVECKLWRNPEARRKVLAQVIDYASEMSTWNYDTLELAVKSTKTLVGDGKSRSLYETVSAAAELDEVAFHDAVSRNLKRGRLLLVIVGDGIREGLETMAEFLQKHAGLHFHLAIVELALFEVPGTGFIAQPRVLARTTTIERVVFTLDGPRAASSALPPQQAQSPRPATMTQEQFFDDLRQNSPVNVERLVEFLGNISRYNILPDYNAKTLTLRWHHEDDRDWNLGTIVNRGEVWMDYHSIQARNANVVELSKRYLEQLAALMPGARVNRTRSGSGWNISGPNGHTPRIEELLAMDDQRIGWERAIAQFVAAIEQSSDSE